MHRTIHPCRPCASQRGRTTDRAQRQTRQTAIARPPQPRRPRGLKIQSSGTLNQTAAVPGHRRPLTAARAEAEGARPPLVTLSESFQPRAEGRHDRRQAAPENDGGGRPRSVLRARHARRPTRQTMNSGLHTESDRRRLRPSPTSHGSARESRRRRPLTERHPRPRRPTALFRAPTRRPPRHSHPRPDTPTPRHDRRQTPPKDEGRTCCFVPEGARRLTRRTMNSGLHTESDRRRLRSPPTSPAARAEAEGADPSPTTRQRRRRPPSRAHSRLTHHPARTAHHRNLIRRTHRRGRWGASRNSASILLVLAPIHPGLHRGLCEPVSGPCTVRRSGRPTHQCARRRRSLHRMNDRSRRSRRTSASPGDTRASSPRRSSRVRPGVPDGLSSWLGTAAWAGARRRAASAGSPRRRRRRARARLVTRARTASWSSGVLSS